MAAESTPVLTNVITSYDGIFKGIYDEELRKQFLNLRVKLSQGKWQEGRDILAQALAESHESPADKKTLQLLEEEINRYLDQKIDQGVEAKKEANWDDVQKRDISRIDASHFELPQGIFYLNVAIPGSPSPVQIVGRKILSDLWIKNKIPELYCSFISADMILGLFVDQRVTESKVVIHFYPFTSSEKLQLMRQVMNTSFGQPELVFPYPLLKRTNFEEFCSPPQGWEVDDAFDVMLGCGEVRIRDYTIQFMKSAHPKNARLYDPACSTGVFLSTLKKAFPDSYTIGQDLSQQMADISRERVDEVHCGNAMVPKIKPGTADFTFVRFINSEVVKSHEAEDLLIALLPTLKTGGYMIIFGHTPVLVSSANLKALSGFKIIQNIATATDNSGIFQYYVLQKL